MKIKISEKRIKEIIREEILKKESIASTINLVSPYAFMAATRGQVFQSEGNEAFSPASSNKKGHLNKEFREKLDQLMDDMPRWSMKLLTTYRSIPDQKDVMRKGFSKIKDAYFGLHTSLTAEGERNSYAVDVWPVVAGSTDISPSDTERWNDLMEFYSELGQTINEKYSDSLSWGGDWSQPYNPEYLLSWKSNTPMGWDPGHIEFKGVDLQKMKENTVKGLETLSQKGERDESEEDLELPLVRGGPGDGEGEGSDPGSEFGSDSDVDPGSDFGD